MNEIYTDPTIFEQQTTWGKTYRFMRTKDLLIFSTDLTHIQLMTKYNMLPSDVLDHGEFIPRVHRDRYAVTIQRHSDTLQHMLPVPTDQERNATGSKIKDLLSAKKRLSDFTIDIKYVRK